MKRKVMSKFYLLYNNKQQEKFLSMAASEENMKEESEYYITGVWFSYDSKDGSNLLENEKEIKNTFFPKEPKVRARYGEVEKNITFKWVG